MTNEHKLTLEMNARLRKVSPEALNLFFSLIPLLAPYCDRHYATKVPDYRFFKNHVFCVLVPMIKERLVKVDLRADRVFLYSSILDLIAIDMDAYGRPGIQWIKFKVNANGTQVDEAVRLVAKVSEENTELMS